MQTLDMDQDLLKHGLQRAVFAVPIVSNWRNVLTANSRKFGVPTYSVHNLSELAKERWLIPRAERRPEYKDHDRRSVIETIIGANYI